jgi:hypothetical protein
MINTFIDSFYKITYLMDPFPILSEQGENLLLIEQYYSDLDDFYRRHLAKISKTADFGIINVVIDHIRKLDIAIPIAKIILDAQPPNDPQAKSEFIESLTVAKLAQAEGDDNVIFKLITHEIGTNGYVNMLNSLINKGINLNLKVIFQYAIPNNFSIMQQLFQLDPRLKEELDLDVLLEATDEQLKFMLDQNLDRAILLEYFDLVLKSNRLNKLALIVPYISKIDLKNHVLSYALSNYKITYSMVASIIKTIPGIHEVKIGLLWKLADDDDIDPDLILKVLDPTYPNGNRLLVRESHYSLKELINLYRLHRDDFIPFLEKQVMNKVARELPLTEEYSKAVDKFGKKSLLDYQNEAFILKSNLSVLEAIVNNKIIQLLNSNGIGVSKMANIDDPDATAWFVIEGIYEMTINGIQLKLMGGSVIYLLKPFDIILQEVEEGSAMMALK